MAPFGRSGCLAVPQAPCSSPGCSSPFHRPRLCHGRIPTWALLCLSGFGRRLLGTLSRDDSWRCSRARGRGRGERVGLSWAEASCLALGVSLAVGVQFSGCPRSEPSKTVVTLPGEGPRQSPGGGSLSPAAVPLWMAKPPEDPLAGSSPEVLRGGRLRTSPCGSAGRPEPPDGASALRRPGGSSERPGWTDPGVASRNRESPACRVGHLPMLRIPPGAERRPVAGCGRSFRGPRGERGLGRGRAGGLTLCGPRTPPPPRESSVPAPKVVSRPKLPCQPVPPCPDVAVRPCGCWHCSPCAGRICPRGLGLGLVGQGLLPSQTLGPGGLAAFPAVACWRHTWSSFQPCLGTLLGLEPGASAFPPPPRSSVPLNCGPSRQAGGAEAVEPEADQVHL